MKFLFCLAHFQKLESFLLAFFFQQQKIFEIVQSTILIIQLLNHLFCNFLNYSKMQMEIGKLHKTNLIKVNNKLLMNIFKILFQKEINVQPYV